MGGVVSWARFEVSVGLLPGRTFAKEKVRHERILRGRFGGGDGWLRGGT